MTKTPPGFTRTLLSIAVPVTLQNLLASSFTLIDTMMIGRLGDTPLAAVGMALWLENEQQIDAVTAVSGSGPAYFFLLIEAMTAAGEQLGLPKAIAAQLTLQTSLGAAHMAVASDVDAAELRRRVTSPNGTTEAAIKTFQAGGFAELVEQALSAAAKRSAELAEQLGK